MSPAVAAEWERCRAWIVPALEDVTEAELVERLDNGQAQIWPGAECAMVTALVADDEPKLVGWLAGGSLREILEIIPGIESWARAQGATAAWIYGRNGWRRALAGRGYKVVGDGLRKAL